MEFTLSNSCLETILLLLLNPILRIMQLNTKNKKIIARLLLCCIALVSLPFHSFLHQHDSVPYTKDHTPESNNLVQISEHSDCISCIIAQIDIIYISQKEWKLPPLLFGVVHINDFLSQIARTIYTTSSRAPPAYLL